MGIAIKYSILRLLRNKSNLFWILCFPVALGILFKLAFSNLDTAGSFTPIPVAVVYETSDENFAQTIENLSKEGEEQMLDATTCDLADAKQLLEEKEIVGILTCSDQVSLTISADMDNESMNQSILSSFVDQYNVKNTILQETASNHPQALPELLARLTSPSTYRRQISLAYHENDVYVQYFTNLLAMACLYTAIGGVIINIENQADLSPQAMRKNISATSKPICLIADLISYTLVEFLLNLLGYLFIVFVLQIDMTTRMGLCILALFVSTLTGISLGFCIGSIGTRSENAKIGMVFAVVMPCCFFSGLMVGNMRMIVENYAPWFNRINPAALISDCFYSLTAYESLDRYLTNLLTLIILTVVFCTIGIVRTRRNRYANI